MYEKIDILGGEDATNLTAMRNENINPTALEYAPTKGLFKKF